MSDRPAPPVGRPAAPGHGSRGDAGSASISARESTPTLDDVGLRPRNLPERVARKKLVEELLDRIVERGFLTLGDLRDAVSRNNSKQPDCAGPARFFHGDALLQADRRLAVVLDGVYHGGEAYLRGIQRFSLLAFGTRTGRFLTQYLAVPFGGAFLVLAGLDHLIES